jgi:hypothetical protein
MVNIDALLSEWAYRCKKGYPDMDSPSDLKVLKNILNEWEISLPEFQEQVITEQEEEKSSKRSSTSVVQLIQKMAKEGVLKDNHIEFLTRYLNSRPFQEKIDEYLGTKNIDGNTFGKDETAANEKVFQILQREEQVDKFSEYIKNPLNLSDLPERGNLFDEVKKASGLTDLTIQKLLHIKGQEEGRGVGKAEIFLSMFFGDVKMRIVGKGDLTWNGEYLEVKGSSARLGGRDTPWQGFKNSILGQLAQEYDKSDKNLSSLIINLADEVDPPTDIAKLKEGIKELANAVYGKSDIIDKVVDGLSEEDLKNGEKVKRALIKLYYTHYTKSENVNHFIFVNTSIKKNKQTGEKTFGKNNSRYRLFSADDIEKLIDANQMVVTSSPAVDNLYPSLNTI